MKYLFISILIFLSTEISIAKDNIIVLPEGFIEFKNHPKLPNFSYLDESGNFQSINITKGKKTIIHFWATWCNPCIEELPLINKFIESENSKDFDFLFISVDIGGSNAIMDFLEKHKLKKIGVASDPNGSVQRILNIRGFPTTIIINKNGEVSYKVEGKINWNDNKVIDFLNLM